LSEQLHNELVKSNTIFKENPLLNEAPEKNKYYNIYSWKTTPEHGIYLFIYFFFFKKKIILIIYI